MLVGRTDEWSVPDNSPAGPEGHRENSAGGGRILARSTKWLGLAADPTVEPDCKELEREELKWQRWQQVCAFVMRNPELREVVARPGLPAGPAVERILRYETTSERQLYAMDQLERLQRQRKGEVVPPR